MTGMKIVCASDSFKGSLSSMRTAELFESAAEEVLSGARVLRIPMADGGEGTAFAMTQAAGGETVSAMVHDPLMNIIEASYGMLGGGRAVIEMAAASGLVLVPEDKRDPLITTSYGTGELILDAVERGARDITIAIGGSATNDGGMGCMSALGYVFRDEKGHKLAGSGCSLGSVASIDAKEADPRLAECRFTVMCDVENPLTGPDGATYVYGPQKGADEDSLEMLEDGMEVYRNVLEITTGMDCDEFPGAGAAGGMGAALYALLGAELRPGIEAVLDLAGFDDKIRDADLVITGEGRADAQSLMGKVMQGVAFRAWKAGVPVTAIVGSLGDGWEGLYDCGINEVIPIAPEGMSTEEAMRRAEELYRAAAVKYLLTLKQTVVQ